MGIENLAEDLLKEPDEGKEKKPKAPGRIEDDIIEGLKTIGDEIHELQLRAEESKEAKRENAAEFQKELADAEQESEEWKKLLNLATEKRKPTVAEAAVLKEERLAALGKASEAAKSAGVERLESIETELRATEKAIEDYEPLDTMHAQSPAIQAEGMALREKERLLREARLWLKKAMIIQALMEVKTETKSEPASSKKSPPKKSEEKLRRIVGPNEVIKLPMAEGQREREVRVVKLGNKIIVECAKFGDAVEVIENIEREGLQGIGVDKGLGLIDLETGRINREKVEIRFFAEESGNVRKSVSINRYIE